MMNTFQQLQTEELAAARHAHPRPQTSFHHGYAVILEELEEFWEEVRKKSAQRDRGAMLSELVQIAAMAQRTAEDLLLHEKAVATTKS